MPLGDARIEAEAVQICTPAPVPRDVQIFTTEPAPRREDLHHLNLYPRPGFPLRTDRETVQFRATILIDVTVIPRQGRANHPSTPSGVPLV